MEQPSSPRQVGHPHGTPSPEPVRYSIHSFEAGDNGIHVKLKQHGVRFILAISSSKFRNSPAQNARFKDVWNLIDAHESRDPKIWEYLGDTLEPFEPVLDEIAPFIAPSGKLTMADLDKGKCYSLELDSVDDRLRPSRGRGGGAPQIAWDQAARSQNRRSAQRSRNSAGTPAPIRSMPPSGSDGNPAASRSGAAASLQRMNFLCA